MVSARMRARFGRRGRPCRGRAICPAWGGRRDSQAEKWWSQSSRRSSDLACRFAFGLDRSSDAALSLASLRWGISDAELALAWWS